MVSFVPPQPITKGLAAGKSTAGVPSVVPSELPLSPDAAKTVTPMVEASSHAEFSASRDCAVHELSGPPQLIETIEGFNVASCTAVVTASMNPWSVLGAKYAAICAAGATAPATSMSSSTSPSAPLGSPVGEFVAPSTETEVTFGVEISRLLKKELRSLVVYPPPSSITPM